METIISTPQYEVRVTIRTEQSVELNRTVVWVERVEVRAKRSAVPSSCWLTGRILVNGMKAAGLELGNAFGCELVLSDAFSGGGVGSWSGYSCQPVEADHAADGTCTVSVRAELVLRLTTGTLLDSFSGTAMMALPRIPRVTEMEASPVELGQEMELRLRRAAAFSDTVTWRCGGASGIVAENTDADTLRWVPPLELAEQAPDSTEAAVTFTIETRTGSTVVGTGTITVYCPLPTDILPTAEVEVTDAAGWEARFGSFIQSQSLARVQTAAAGTAGASIREIRVVCGALAGTGADVVFTLPDSGRVAIAVTVTDSRGRSITVERQLEVTAYDRPAATLREAFRCDSTGSSQADGAYVKLVFDAGVTPLSGGSAVYYAVRKLHGGTGEEKILLADYTGVTCVTGGTAVLPAGIDSSYDCTIQAEDPFTVTRSPAVKVSVAFALLDFSRTAHAIGIGMRAAREATVSIGLDTDMTEHRIRNLAEPEEDGDAVTKRYVDERIREALGLVT